MKRMFPGRCLVLLPQLAPLLAWADYTSSIPASIRLHVSPQGGWSGNTSAVPPAVFFGGFNDTAVGSYLTLATGPEFINSVSRFSASFTGILAPDRCQIVDAPIALALRDWDYKQQLYQKQTRQLQSCVQIRVHDTGGILPAPDQKHCKVAMINENEAVVSGGLCYFMVSSKSNFVLKYEIQTQCADEQQFSAAGLEPLDIFGLAGFYLSGDSSGQSPNLVPLGSTGLRMTIEPTEPSVKLSTDMGIGNPRWPVVAYPDVHMGSFEIIQESQSATAGLNHLLFAQSGCRDESNQECNFHFPLGMQMNLREVGPDGSTTLLDQWYFGGVVPPFWQGFIPGARQVSNVALRSGHRYRLEADLTFSSMYYRLFRDGFSNFMINQWNWSIDPTQPLGPLQPVATIPALKAMSPNRPLPDLPPLLSGGASDLAVQLSRLRSLLTDIDWPPVYEQMCGANGCVRAVDGQAKLKVGVDFTIDGFVDGKAQTSNLRSWRESAFLPEYNQTTNALMRPQCD